jgi:ankyrin repeat protein
MMSLAKLDISHDVSVIPAIDKLPSDLLGQVLLRVPNLDAMTLALVNKSWFEAVGLDSNPKVWGRLLLAGGKPGVLESAIRNAKVEDVMRVVEALIEAGADVNPTTVYSDGMTPLFAACKEDNAAVLEVLLKAGSDPNKEWHSMAPLYYACSNGRLEIVKLLISYGADVNEKCVVGDTPLFAACGEDLPAAVVEVLLKAGADINKESDGWTPLFLVCHCGSVEIVKLLISYGVDVNKIEEESGMTPLEIARAEGHAVIMELLLKAGATEKVEEEVEEEEKEEEEEEEEDEEVEEEENMGICRL